MPLRGVSKDQVLECTSKDETGNDFGFVHRLNYPLQSAAEAVTNVKEVVIVTFCLSRTVMSNVKNGTSVTNYFKEFSAGLAKI